MNLSEVDESENEKHAIGSAAADEAEQLRVESDAVGVGLRLTVSEDKKVL